MYTYNLTIHHIINNRALKTSEFKMNAILDFARFLSSGCFVGDLEVILGGFAVVVCAGCLVCPFFCPGGFCPEGGGVCKGGFCPGRYYPGVLSGGFSTGGFVRWVCPAGFVRGGGVCPGFFCPGGYCPGGLVRGGGGGYLRIEMPQQELLYW